MEGGTYKFKFNAEEGLSKKDQYHELFKALHTHPGYDFYYYEIKDDSEGLAVSSKGKRHNLANATAGAAANKYDSNEYYADGGRRRRHRRRTRKAKKHSKKRRTSRK